MLTRQHRFLLGCAVAFAASEAGCAATAQNLLDHLADSTAACVIGNGPAPVAWSILHVPDQPQQRDCTVRVQQGCVITCE